MRERDSFHQHDERHFRFTRDTRLRPEDFYQPVPRWRRIQSLLLWTVVTALIAAAIYTRIA